MQVVYIIGVDAFRVALFSIRRFRITGNQYLRKPFVQQLISPALIIGDNCIWVRVSVRFKITKLYQLTRVDESSWSD